MSLQNESHHKVQKFNSYNIEYKEINILSLSQVFVFEQSLGRLAKGGFFGKLKIISLDNYIKALISVFYIFKKKTKKNVEYLFINDIYNLSMVSNLRAVSNVFPYEYTEVVCDKRLFQKGSVFLFRYFRPFSYIKELYQIFKTIKKESKTIKNVAKEFRISNFLLKLNIIESVFVLNSIEGVFNRHKKIKSITLNSDVHKINRAFVLVAKRKKIKTHVIQHGSTVLEYGYLPVLADTMFTWGSLSNDWFVKRNTLDSKLKITGTPKTDYIVNYQLEDENKLSVKNILLIINPIGDCKVKEFLDIIFLAKLHSKYNLTIKLHPGSIDNRDLVEEVFPRGVEIIKKENIHDLIYKNDVVITTTSTVGSEAVIFEKPLIQIKLEGLNTVLEYEQFDCCHNIYNSDQLNLLLDDYEKLMSKRMNYNVFIKKYFYKIDGNSVNRIINYLT